MLRLSCRGKVVILAFYGAHCIRHVSPEGLRAPAFAVNVGVGNVYRIYIPRKVESELSLIFYWLYVANVEHPHVLAVHRISLRQLIGNECGRSAAEPKVVLRHAPVRQVVIHATAALAPLLFGCGELAHVAVVVVGPDQRNIIGQTHSEAIRLQCFLVRTEYLRHIDSRFAQVALNHLALFGYYFLKRVAPFLVRIVARHARIVYATHAESVDGIIVFRLLYALAPVHFYGIAVVFPVIRAGQTTELERKVMHPLVNIVSQHLLAMARAKHNVILPCQLRVLLVIPERLCTWVHRRPQQVGFQAEHQPHHLLVSARTNVVHVLVKMLGGPRLQSPIFVVDEQSAVFHRRRACHRRATRHADGLVFARSHVSPPAPWRHAHHPGKFHKAVGRAAWVASVYDESLRNTLERFVNHGYAERLPLAFYIAYIYLPGLYKAIHP